MKIRLGLWYYTMPLLMFFLMGYHTVSIEEKHGTIKGRLMNISDVGNQEDTPMKDFAIAIFTKDFFDNWLKKSKIQNPALIYTQMADEVYYGNIRGERFTDELGYYEISLEEGAYFIVVAYIRENDMESNFIKIMGGFPVKVLADKTLEQDIGHSFKRIIPQ